MEISELFSGRPADIEDILIAHARSTQLGKSQMDSGKFPDVTIVPVVAIIAIVGIVSKAL
jgi:hypothetical protein